ncbi:unnamed protein product [Miscanthus lutarioriparius]|uniref:DUF1618 domain-containing protein n=1 Tax=Miscanthus lutarioriparius TaxID=422564 RepID=A0A811RWS4_9POAL|nr:unnamed protein product [Miscanthus lutarioriparius]
MSTAAGFPNWVMLEPVVFRRDDDKSFPDESKAPVRASGTTSWEAQFRFAFDLAEPPSISRIFAQLPGFPGPSKESPLAMLTTHRHLALFRVGTTGPCRRKNFFIYSAGKPSSLEKLPTCTRDLERVLHDGSPSRRPPETGKMSRLHSVRSMGLLCQGEEEFAVAELHLYPDKRKRKVFADIYLFLKSAGKWTSSRLPILHSDDPDDAWQLCIWLTDTVIPVDRWLCWIDYDRGILFHDVFGAAATVSFLRFPLHKFSRTPPEIRRECSGRIYRGVSAIDAAGMLKFVDVTRDDGIGYGALKPGAGFTITCHTLLPSSLSSGMVWNKDWTVTSDELWTDNRLPREVPMFPQVNIDRPHVVHFLISDFTYVMKKMWVVTIDMNTRTVESFYQYINGEEDIGTEREFLTKERSMGPRPFLPSEFSKYLSSR